MSVEKLSNQFSSMSLSNSYIGTSSHSNAQDFDTVLQNDACRKLFGLFLKEFNNSTDNLLTLYLICCCFQNQKIDDRHRIKQILEQTYNKCFVKNQLPYLSKELREKLRDTLQKTTYNESVFNAVKKEIKILLEKEYFPMFLKSKYYQQVAQAKHESQQSTSSLKNFADMRTKSSKNIKFDDLDMDSNKVSASFAIPQLPGKQHQLKHSKSTTTTATTITTTTNTNTTTTTNNNNTQHSIKKAQNIPSNNKLNRTSIQNSNKQNLNESTLSLNVAKKPLKTTSGAQMPPNPYTVITKAIPVSAQDSEIQSIVSNDNQNYNHHYKSTNMPKLDKHIKQNLLANKNAKIAMNDEHAFHALLPVDVQPTKGKSDSKKPSVSIAETDPKKFFDELSSKLEQVLQEQQQINCDHSNTKQRSLSSIQLAPYSANSCGTGVLISRPQEDINVNLSTQKLDENIDSQLDEHLNRVYNQFSNKSSLNPKLAGSPRVNKVKNNVNTSKISCLEQSVSNYSFNNCKSSGKRSLNPFENHQHHPHHFYQLTSTSKEVDIDSHHNHHQHHMHHNHHTFNNNNINQHNHGHNMIDSGVASTRSIASIERVNDWLTTSNANDQNLENEQYNNNYNQNPYVKADSLAQQKPLINNINNNQNNANRKSSKVLSDDLSIKTTVAYYLPGEDLAYISTFNGKHLTLAQFKHLITKKGNFRYFFKTKSDLLDDKECVVYEEATDDQAFVPMFNGKVIAKIEKISTTNNNSNLTLTNNANLSICQNG